MGFKLVQLLMVLAVFNPFCCCTAAGLFADSSGVAASIHSCCVASSEEPNSEDQHDPEKCPHKALKNYEIASYKDAGSTHSTHLLLPSLFIFLDSLVYEPAVESTHLTALEFAVEPPPVSLMQVYCVYRI